MCWGGETDYRAAGQRVCVCACLCVCVWLCVCVCVWLRLCAWLCLYVSCAFPVRAACALMLFPERRQHVHAELHGLLPRGAARDAQPVHHAHDGELPGRHVRMRVCICICANACLYLCAVRGAPLLGVALPCEGLLCCSVILQLCADGLVVRGVSLCVYVLLLLLLLVVVVVVVVVCVCVCVHACAFMCVGGTAATAAIAHGA